MNRIIVTSILLIGSSCLFAQVAPKNRTSRYPVDSGSVNIREKLVQLALQNPDFEIADRKVNIATYQLRKSKGDWLSPITPTINLNELTVRRRNPNDQIFFPLYNVGIALPLNFFTQRQNDMRIARENLSIAEAEKNGNFRRIRAEVLSRYEDFLMYKARLERANRLIQDENLAYLQAEKDFEDGAIDIQTYNKAYLAWSNQLDRKEEVQRNYNIAKLQLEEMIGVSIEQVQSMK